MSSKITGDRDAAMAEILTQTAEVQVTIVATITVPTDSRGNWLPSDAVNGAMLALSQGRADLEAHQVTPTGAPGPFTVAEGLSADEATSWTPGKRI